MNGWLLDTNVVASLSARDGAPSVKAWAEAQDENRFYLSIITLAEYDKGVHQLREDDPRRARYATNRDLIETRFRRRILPVTDAVVRRWGAIAGRVKRDTGHPPPVVDTLLAATAVESNLYLVTRNQKDVAWSGATIFNPWEDNAEAFPVRQWPS